MKRILTFIIIVFPVAITDGYLVAPFWLCIVNGALAGLLAGLISERKSH